MAIDEIAKPVNVWCPHCDVGVGCKIYATKPSECTTFQCGWLSDSKFGDEWYPGKSKMVLTADNGGNRITIAVDPGRADAWRKDPYYRQIKTWAHAALPHQGQVMIKNGDRMTMILPDDDVDLGIVRQDQLIVTGEQQTPQGVKLRAFVIDRDDPRAKGLNPGNWSDVILKK
ncbi:hypothetical protein [Dongia sp.]|uniref:hypothetical protein n=1 Tax=Dongia sp. TaxID=1977262 RepID=UPI0035B3EAAA